MKKETAQKEKKENESIMGSGHILGTERKKEDSTW